MSDVLTRICADKLKDVAQLKAATPLDDLESRARAADVPRGFAAGLDAAVHDRGYGLICEIKKASPSAGVIRPDFDPAALARAYELGGAACLSVLTDKPYFQGESDFLIQARAACGLPVLRKDFMLDPWQVVEARAIGADCILLIMAALSDEQARELEDVAVEHGMDVLVEVHDEAELERALSLLSPLIGVNNRNLKTLEIDLSVTERLSRLLPADRILVCESGLKRPEDLARMEQSGARRFLIGESLMKQDDVASGTRYLMSGARPAPEVSAGLTHLDSQGHARMIDVSAKPETTRTAIAEGRVRMSPDARAQVLSGQSAKGDVLAAARIAGIQGAKRTAELIPLCHPLPLSSVAVDLEPLDDGLRIVATTRTTGRTGVEMEALTAVSTAALTVYDMLKAVDKSMRIEGIRLLEKTGGKSGTYRAE